MSNRSLESNKPCAAIIYVYKSKFVLWNGNGILLNQNFAKIDFFKKKKIHLSTISKTVQLDMSGEKWHYSIT